MKKMLGVVVILISGIANAVGPKSVTGDVFYVYQDAMSRANHYCPSGWAGDYGDMHFNQKWDKNPGKGKYCIQVTYSAQRKQNAGWAGIFYQDPCNNWGEKNGGYNLTGFKTLKFMARGEKGKEYIDKFMIGGITGQTAPGDSDNNQTDAIELTKEWKEYSLDLKGMDLSEIISGFSFFFNAEYNPSGLTMYIDEIRLEK